MYEFGSYLRRKKSIIVIEGEIDQRGTTEWKIMLV